MKYQNGGQENLQNGHGNHALAIKEQSSNILLDKERVTPPTKSK